MFPYEHWYEFIADELRVKPLKTVNEDFLCPFEGSIFSFVIFYRMSIGRMSDIYGINKDIDS